MATELGIVNIIEAEDGQKAVDTYKAEKPNIVFMDITMPEKDGTTALKEIVEFDEDAKVVMASSIGTSGKLAEAIELGEYNFLQKPVDKEKFKNVIIQYLEEN